MIELRSAESDADLEAWRRVRMSVLPNERCASIEEMRRTATPETLWLVAELDGKLAGSGLARRSDFEGIAFLAPRVLPEKRRRGVGTALLERLAPHAEAQGFTQASCVVDDDGSLAFAQHHGFRGSWQQVEQVRAIGEREDQSSAPPGVELVSLAARPDLFIRTYKELAVAALAELPIPGSIDVSFEDWEREWVSWPEGSFVALAGDEIVGCAGLIRDEDVPTRAEHSLTAVRGDRRGQGIARALKQQTIAWASANGLSELYTWTQDGNEAMRGLNASLGYATRSVCTRLRAPLPLP
ncbi:MAG: GNAT family N-acetyltransferase [Gaiellaceae bacterium]